MRGRENYEDYRKRLRKEGRASYWTFLVVGLIGLAYAVYRGLRSGFSDGEIWFIIIFGLYVLANAILLSPIYNLLADAMVRRRQRLRDDPVDPDDAGELRYGGDERIDDVLQPEVDERSKPEGGD